MFHNIKKHPSLLHFSSLEGLYKSDVKTKKGFIEWGNTFFTEAIREKLERNEIKCIIKLNYFI